MKIIGIAGKAGTGKSEAARILARNGYCPVAFADGIKRILMEVYGFTKEQLWGPSQNRNAPDKRYKRWECDSVVGDEAARVFAALDAAATGKTLTKAEFQNEYMVEYLTARLALQEFGSAGRKCYKDTWVEYTLRQVDKLDDHLLRYAPELGVYHIYESSRPPTPRYKGVVLLDCRFYNEMEAVKKRGGKIALIKRQVAEIGAAWHQHESETSLPPEGLFDYVINNDGGLVELERSVLALL